MTEAVFSGVPARPGGFALRQQRDRNFFLLLVALIWVGILTGFGPQIRQRLLTGAAPYPLIVHFHAVAFVGWLALLTTQVLLIRARRPDIHRRLGLAGAGLAAVIIVTGPATALVMHAVTFGKAGRPPAFLAVQFTDILGFAGLVTAALVWRSNSAAHKRLMLLATLCISDAGFSRWLSAPLGSLLGSTYWAQFAAQYLPTDLLALGIGAYDLITRGRLYSAYVAGVVWTGALHMLAMALLFTAWWPPIANHLIGH
jgi:uncharacterized membrane protein YozB (DUF420 family)